MGIRPEHIGIDTSGTTHTVDLTEALGGVSYVHLTSETGGKIVVEERGDNRSVSGQRVGINIPSDRAMLFDKETEQRLR